MDKKSISVVIPIFCEEKNINLFFSSLREVCSKLDWISWRFIFVNDGSTDGSLDLLRTLSRDDNRVTVLDFVRNFGKELALTAGVFEAQGSDAVITLDSDMQHPPELIPKLVDVWASGALTVVALRRKTEGESWFKERASDLYYWIMRRMSRLNLVAGETDFRIIDKSIVREYCRSTEKNRMYRALLDWLGFEKKYIEFDAPARGAGVRGYSYSKLFGLATSSISIFSSWPLWAPGVLGLLISVASGVMLLWMLISYIVQSVLVFTPLAIVVVANTFLVGIILLALGLVGFYVGAVLKEVTGRPLFITRETINVRTVEQKSIGEQEHK